MRKIVRLVLPVMALLPLMGCAAGTSEKRLDGLEAEMRNMQVIDLRVGQLEGRVGRVEGELGELRAARGAAPEVKKAAAREQTRQRAAQSSAPAPPQEVSVVPISTYPSAPPSNTLTLEKAREGRGVRNPAGMPLDSDLTPVRPSSASPQPPAAPDAGPGLLPLGQGASFPAVPPSPVPAPAPATAPAPEAKKPAAKPDQPKSSSGQTGQKSYDAALALYNQGQYGKAKEAFAAFLQSSAGSSLAPNALYWQGECEYSLGRYDAAIMLFKDVAGKYPKHDKAAAALLKAGYAYERLGDMENARFYWQILLDDFPKSGPASLARKRMAANGKG